MRKRRQTEVFSLSFLDCICCGFGAVILFYMIISAQSGVERIRKTDDLASQVRLLEEQVLEGTKNLVVLRNSLAKTTSETVCAASRATRLNGGFKRPRKCRRTRSCQLVSGSSPRMVATWSNQRLPMETCPISSR